MTMLAILLWIYSSGYVSILDGVHLVNQPGHVPPPACRSNNPC